MRSLLFILFTSIYCLSELPSYAQKTSVIGRPELAYGVVADLSRTLTIEEIVELHQKDSVLSMDQFKFDPSVSVYWVAINVPHHPDKSEKWILKCPYIDTAELYISSKDGTFTKLISGEDIPLNERPLKFFETIGFPLTLSPSNATFYLRIVSTSGFSTRFRNIDNIKLLSQSQYDNDTLKARYFHGIFLGILFAMMIYNLIIYFVYRDKSYAVYALFILTQAAYHLSITGFLSEFVFYDLPTIGKYMPYVVAAISLVAYVYFSQVYLDAKRLVPKLNKYYNWLYPAIIGTNILGYFYRIDIANSVMLVLGVSMVTFAFVIALAAYRKGYRPALYFLVASILAFISYYVFVMMRLNVLPTIFITRYAFQINVAIQSLLFAMGLADRMRTIIKELADKKLEKERLEKEQEKVLREILEQQNEMLELKVVERTSEIQEAHQQLENQHQQLEIEKKKSDMLLLNILPEEIALELKEKGKAVARDFDMVSIIFTDFKGFTEASARLSAQDLVAEINTCFEAFDGIMAKYGIEKIKTIGDAYMAAGGLPVPTENSVRNTVFAALEMQAFIVARHKSKVESGFPAFEMRVGIHTGPVVAGIVGVKKFQYDIWGDTVNTASRMESAGAVGKVNVSQSTYELLKDDAQFTFESRGKIEAKGKGEMEMWFVSNNKALA